MNSYSINESETAVFQANGTATVTFSPPSPEYWDITTMGVTTTDPVDETIIPTAIVTLDGVFKEGTYSGNMDSSNCVYRVEKGQRFVCTWTGGTSGRSATFTLNGTRTLY